MLKRFLIPLLLLIPLQLSSASALKVKILPQVLMVNNQVRLNITVEREEDNRQVIIEWYLYSEDFASRHFIELNGASSPRIYQYYILFREPGEWTVKVILKKSLRDESEDFRVQVIGLQDEAP